VVGHRARRLGIQSTHQAAIDLVDEVVLESGSAGYSPKALYGVRLALDEALSNAIQHGNRNNPNKNIVVDYSITSQELRISVTDEGGGFEVARSLTTPESASGPGISLMVMYMTQVEYNQGGRCVTLVKHKSCSKPHSFDDAAQLYGLM